MSEQIGIAVDQGVVAPPVREILNLWQLVETASALPPQIIEGVLLQGCKMILDGTTRATRAGACLTLP